MSKGYHLWLVWFRVAGGDERTGGRGKSEKCRTTFSGICVLIRRSSLDTPLGLSFFSASSACAVCVTRLCRLLGEFISTPRTAPQPSCDTFERPRSTGPVLMCRAFSTEHVNSFGSIRLGAQATWIGCMYVCGGCCDLQSAHGDSSPPRASSLLLRLP